MSGSDSGIGNRRMPSDVWTANPPFTPGSHAITIRLLIGCLLGLDGESVAHVDACDHADGHQRRHGDDGQCGAHRLNAFERNWDAASNFHVCAFLIPKRVRQRTCLGVASLRAARFITRSSTALA